MCVCVCAHVYVCVCLFLLKVELMNMMCAFMCVCTYVRVRGHVCVHLSWCSCTSACTSCGVFLVL